MLNIKKRNMIYIKVYKHFENFNGQGLLNRTKKLNIVEDFSHHQLTAMMTQETNM